MTHLPSMEEVEPHADLSAVGWTQGWASGGAGNLPWRRLKARLFRWLCLLATLVGVVLLVVLLGRVLWQGVAWFDWQFLTSFASRRPAAAGIKAAIAGSVWLLGLTVLFSLPVGIGAAIYLEEFAPRNRLTSFIAINIANLAGVPSVVYGILGLAVFVRTLGMGRSVVAGAATMSLLILPVIIIASREAIRAVPQSIRHAAFALGASRWQTVLHHVLPTGAPGILTGVILALSRAIGETAPLIVVGALTYVTFVPQVPTDPFTVLPIQIYHWVSMPQAEFHALAAAGIIALLTILFFMNGVAVYLRYRFDRRLKG